MGQTSNAVQGAGARQGYGRPRSPARDRQHDGVESRESGADCKALLRGPARVPDQGPRRRDFLRCPRNAFCDADDGAIVDIRRPRAHGDARRRGLTCNVGELRGPRNIMYCGCGRQSRIRTHNGNAECECKAGNRPSHNCLLIRARRCLCTQAPHLLMPLSLGTPTQDTWRSILSASQIAVRTGRCRRPVPGPTYFGGAGALAPYFTANISFSFANEGVETCFLF